MASRWKFSRAIRKFPVDSQWTSSSESNSRIPSWYGEMSTPTEEITVDLDAPTGAEVAERAQVAPDGARITKSDSEANLKVEIAEKTQEATAKPVEKPVLTPDEGLKKLQKQLDDEKSARIAAESRE